ncbi:MAG: hypothetical protein IKV01_04665 [Clostridia bacterium]|nr:hypothetical protein [Clostridia bacterium]
MGKVFYIRYKKSGNGVFALFVSLLVIATVVCAAIDVASPEDILAEQTPAIRGVSTDSGIYAVTVIVESQKWDDIRLVLEACEGYGITAVCFMDIAWITANKSHAAEICEKHIPALLVSTDFSDAPRSDVMTYMAVMNDKFMSLTGNYPKYVRYDGTDAGCLSSVLSAYGQFYISAETILSETAVQIRAGGITEIYPSGKETVYAFAKTVATAVVNSLAPVPLSEMLYPQGSEVNANGYQQK